LLTVDTGVADEQVELEVLATRSRAIKQLVGHVYLAAMTTRTLSGCQSTHVRLAADVTVLGPDTTPVVHASVDCVGYDDHLVVSRTARFKRLPLAVFTQLTVRRRRSHFVAHSRH